MRIGVVSARIAAAATFGAFGVGLMSPGAAQERRSVPGEIIVKFRTGTCGGNAASRAARAGADAEAAVSPLVRKLSDTLGVPLVFRRLAAGGDVLLALDRQRLEEQLLGALRAADGVARVDTVREGSGPNAPCRGVQVTFVRPGPGSEEVERAVRRVKEGKPLGTLEVTRRLEERTGLRLLNCLSASGELVVEPDLEALTDETVRRLRARPDVEYAQPNYRVRALRP